MRGPPELYAARPERPSLGDGRGASGGSGGRAGGPCSGGFVGRADESGTARTLRVWTARIRFVGTRLRNRLSEGARTGQSPRPWSVAMDR